MELLSIPLRCMGLWPPSLHHPGAAALHLLMQYFSNSVSCICPKRRLAKRLLSVLLTKSSRVSMIELGQLHCIYVTSKIQTILFGVLHGWKNWVAWASSVNTHQTLDSHAVSSSYAKYNLVIGICRLGWVKPVQSRQKIWFPTRGICPGCSGHDILQLD